MKILLINPPVNRLCDNAINYFPLGIGYIAAATAGAGFETYIYNADLEPQRLPILTNRERIEKHNLFIRAINDESHRVWFEFRKILERLKPSIVGFSCTSASILPCLKMAEDAKKISHSTIVFGGIHPTILPEETARSKNIDFIISGDAEKSFLSLVKALSENKNPLNIPGIGQYIADKFIFNTPEPLESTIDIFPFPNRDAIVNIEEHKNFLQAMVTSRGCPYRCTFCSGQDITGGIVRYRSPEKVVEEIEFLKERYGMNQIEFYDDSLILNKKRIAEICELIIKKNMNITWSGFTRADSVNQELLKLMKASGCKFLGVGVESGSNRTLRKINKGYTREQAINGINHIKETGINVDMNIIVGFPFETEEDIKDSISLIKELKIPANINTFTPYPKSELYDECVQRGLIKGDMDWALYSQHSPYNDFIQEISPKAYGILQNELITVADKMMKKHYRGLSTYIRKTIKIWHEENNVFKFSKVVSGKIKKRIVNRL
ncbi:MAG: B12-binding domain-containing radical SAM protein [Planctomycetota bacterium]|jgi:radical SAM superfamily enzyme YgiQ (UPF0313 family)